MQDERRTGEGRAVVKHRAGTGFLAAAAVLAAFLTGGCAYRESICGSGEYPVKAVGNKTGAACVPDGQEPPEGYVRYPEGKVPRHVGDTWDEYWSTVVVNDDGEIVGR
ncbi:MAG TPA: hypothetical protein VE546_27850 [Streptomyces sp.]|uniref:SCO0607 family lipoprotein n=1 Tax=Streptomyces sp. TaxID=1931 RepID=UPI002D611AB8|nr:hypothetical protein [Streptomyces sp.]HZG07333.1 hypothetical protein [Streptomyces sp.]